MPARAPRYYTFISDTNNANPWPILNWWIRPGAEAANVKP